MPPEETRTKRRKSRKSESHLSRKPRDRKHHDLPEEPPPEPSERPSTLDDLRKARLTFLETPPDQRKKRMKHEEAASSSAKAKAVDRAPAKARSSVSRTRSRAKETTRSASAKRRRAAPKGGSSSNLDVGGEYVYRPSHEQGEVEGPTNSRVTRDAQNLKLSARSSKTTERNRRLGERRHTAPATPHDRAGDGAKPESSTRPALRKSTTTHTDRNEAAVPRSSTSIKQSADDSVVSAPTASSKRSTSIWGRILGQPSAPSKKPKKTVPCLTCGDDVDPLKTAKLPCKHRMCYLCLKRVFKLSITDPAHMPPRCCTEDAISLKHVDFLFNDKFKETYNNKLREYSTKNKVYCPRKGCGAWIKPEHMKVEEGRKIGKCPNCHNKVCGICNQKMHKSKDCPQDPTVQEFVATAEKSGWKRCYSCSAMVELKEGCNHMTCRCTAEFCMVCGSKWKTCDCAWFNYEQADAFGDPVRFQQEMDRRRQQEERDEAIARRMDALQVDDINRPAAGGWFAWLNPWGPPGPPPNQDPQPPAEEVPAANDEIEDRAEGGLFEDQFAGHEDPGFETGNFPRMVQQPARRRRHNNDPAAMDQEFLYHTDIRGTNVIPVMRHRYQRQRVNPQVVPEGRILTNAEREQLQRRPGWGAGMSRN